MSKIFAKVSERGFFKTLLPLIIVFKKTVCKTDSMKGIMSNAIVCAYVFPARGAFHGREKRAKVKVLTHSWGYEGEMTYCTTSLTTIPLFVSLVPDIMHWILRTDFA